MANIKNFGLVGVAADVQFGKAGPRLVNDAQVFKFKDVSGVGVAPIVAGNATVAGLTVGANGTITMGSNKVTNVAAGEDLTDAINLGQLNAAIDAVNGTGSTLAAEVDKIEAAIGLNTDGTLAAFANGAEAGPAAGATSYKNAIELVSAALKGEIDRALAAEALVTGDLTAEVTRAKAAEKQVADDLAAEIARATGEEADIRADFAAADTAIRAELQAAIAGITWENPVNQMVADVAARDALADLLVGARIYVTEDNKVYTKTADGFDAGEVMVEGAAFFDRETTVPYVFNGEDMVQFNGAAGLTAGLGLIMNGNTMDLDLSTEGGLKFYPDAGNPNNTVGLKLADVSLEVGTGGLKLSGALQTEITALRTDLTAEAAAARLAEGKLASDLADEVTRATGVEDGLLTRMTAVEGKNTTQDGRLDALEAKTSADSGALQLELDAVETSLGLKADGSQNLWANGNYFTAGTAASEGVEAVAADTYKVAIEKLDAALKAMDGAYKEADTALHNTITTEMTDAIDALTTDQIEEGQTNLYFTAARAQAAISVESVVGDDAAKLAYANGVLSLVNVASVKSVADALVAAKAYADAGDVTTLAAAKAYADQVAQSAANSVKYVAKSVYTEFSYTDNPEKSIAADVKGRVHRVKIMIDTAFDATATISVGTTTEAGDLIMTNDSIDVTSPGVYVIELNKLYATDTNLKVFVGGVLSKGAGAVIVEYFTS